MKLSDVEGYLMLFLMVLLLILLVALLGCDKSSQKKQQFAKPEKMSNESYVYLRCLEASPKTSSSLLKKETTHNPLECKSLEMGVISRNKLDRSKEIYKYCADELLRLKTHSWQECFNILNK